MKFAPVSPASTSLDTCKNCVTTLTPLVPIRDMAAIGGGEGIADSQMPFEDTQLMTQVQEPPLQVSMPVQSMPVQSTPAQSKAVQSIPAQSIPAQSIAAQSARAVKRAATNSTVQQHMQCSTTRASSEEGCSPPDNDLMSIPDIAKVWCVCGPIKLPVI